jgi:cytochrome c biogenesis protein CcmG, thiol:disulfide interchange protein DsbE
MRLLVPLLALFLTACGDAPPAKLNVGDPAPAFAAARLDGTTARFPADFDAKPLVIRFWADWCRFCEGEMKAIDAVWRRHRQEGLEVVAINAGQDKASVAAFVNKIGIGYPALLDEDAAIAKRYGVAGLPTTYFVDRQGKVQAKQVGEATEALFEQRATELLR